MITPPFPMESNRLETLEVPNIADGPISVQMRKCFFVRFGKGALVGRLETEEGKKTEKGERNGDVGVDWLMQWCTVSCTRRA
jgi:hypothetical protein